MTGACFCGYDATDGVDDYSIFLVVVVGGGMSWPYSVSRSSLGSRVLVMCAGDVP